MFSYFFVVLLCVSWIFYLYTIEQYLMAKEAECVDGRFVYTLRNSLYKHT